MKGARLTPTLYQNHNETTESKIGYEKFSNFKKGFKVVLVAKDGITIALGVVPEVPQNIHRTIMSDLI